MSNDKALSRDDVRTALRSGETGDDAVNQGYPGWLRDRACCCPSRPVVRVVMPAAGHRLRSVDLLLCGHHYRASRERLEASRAAVYDRTDALISSAAAR
jgi:hypothetical protein